MNKIKNNPDFTENEPIEPVEGDEEEKKPTDEEPVEEGNQSEASTDKEPSEEEKSSETDDKELKKQREEQALQREEEKLITENEDRKRRIAARKESIVIQRKQRREYKEQLKETPQTQQTDDISDIDSEDVKWVERVIRAKGYVPKAELQVESFKQQAKEIQDNWFKSHPEYLPENDSNDVLYSALQEEYGMYAPPKSVSKVKDILERVHKEVKTKFPDKFPRSKSSTSNVATARAKIAGAGAGSSGTSSQKIKSSSGLTLEQRQQLKGFTDEEMDEM